LYAGTIPGVYLYEAVGSDTRQTGTLVLKGILHPHDAQLAQQMQIDGVILSNHGGRQLDGAVSPMRVLPAVRVTVGDFPDLWAVHSTTRPA
jgi:isopentenyl diphosphate isomerase/L-lactate dehydrogenase-like FMN-dependent dehydrogenase